MSTRKQAALTRVQCLINSHSATVDVELERMTAVALELLGDAIEKRVGHLETEIECLTRELTEREREVHYLMKGV
jgi:ribosomal protein S7